MAAENDEEPMVEFLRWLGIEPPEPRTPCQYCGAEWPWCRDDNIVYPAPCAARAATVEGRET